MNLWKLFIRLPECTSAASAENEIKKIFEIINLKIINLR